MHHLEPKLISFSTGCLQRASEVAKMLRQPYILPQAPEIAVTEGTESDQADGN